ncbi:TPA: hypothetical protein VAM30_000521 [Acinetobacter baumannii]|nr:hypothetical protein [Acinetobacter baumannii]
MIKNFNIPLLFEIGLLIPTGFAIIVKMMTVTSKLAWVLMGLFNTTVLCIKYYHGINSELLKATCSILISMILLNNLSYDQNILDAFALILQIIFSALTIKNLIENYQIYK